MNGRVYFLTSYVRIDRGVPTLSNVSADNREGVVLSPLVDGIIVWTGRVFQLFVPRSQKLAGCTTRGPWSVVSQLYAEGGGNFRERGGGGSS